MIEFGEPLHIYGLIFLSLVVVFLLGVMWGNVSAESGQKKAD